MEGNEGRKLVTEKDLFDNILTEEEFNALGMDKPDPNGHLFRPEDPEVINLRETYLKACKHLETVPAQRVLKCFQFKTLCLHQRGLGKIGIEALLTAINGSRRFRSVDLGGNYVGPEGAECLRNLISINKHVTYLNLSNNLLKKSGGLVIAEGLSENHWMETLILSNNQFDDVVGVAIGKALLKHPSLQYLDLGNNFLGSKSGLTIGNALKINTSLTEINLTWNCIRGRGAERLIASLQVNKTLVRLHLGNNGLAKETGKTLGEALAVNTTLQYLDIMSNRIPMKAIKPLVTLGLSQNTGLRTFKIGKNPIESEGLKLILASLTQSEVTELRLLDCSSLILSPEVHDILDFLLQQQPKLVITFGPKGPIFQNQFSSSISQESDEQEDATSSTSS